MDGIRADLARLTTTLDRRFWLIAALATMASLLILGLPTAVIPNPLFTRMTPIEATNVVTWIVSAPLVGLITASYLAKPPAGSEPHTGGSEPHTGGSEWRASAGGVGAFLAIGCPICNKVVVGLLGISGALNVFAPLQPLIGAASVALLGATAAWQLRRRARGCLRCVGSPSASAAQSGARP